MTPMGFPPTPLDMRFIALTGYANPPQICLRAKFLAADMNQHPSRITVPMIRRKGKLTEVSWKEAIDFTASSLERYRGNQFGMICSAQDTLEENYIMQKFSRKVMRSNNIDLLASYPDRALIKEMSGVCLAGTPAGINEAEKADTLLVLATDASDSHPLLENRIRKAFNAGKEVLYAGTHRTRTSDFASGQLYWVPGQEQGFLYLLLAGLARSEKSGGTDRIRKQITRENVSKASELCGVDPEAIRSFTESLSRSKNLLIIAGDSLVRHPSAREIYHMLMNIHWLKNRKQKCRIMFPGYEGNLHAGALVGAHPDYLPGLVPVEDESGREQWNNNWETRLSNIRGLSCNEMVGNIREDGITTLMVAGNMPVHPRLEDLKFLVQLNMFETAITQFANVLLPVTSFLENCGHVFDMGGQLRHLQGTVTGPTEVWTVPDIIEGLAGAMLETGFSGCDPGTIYEEIRTFHVIPEAGKDKEPGTYQPAAPGTEVRDREFPCSLIPVYDHWSYRGNRLSALIDDLKQLDGSRDIGVSARTAKRMKMKEGDRVRVRTETGELEGTAKILEELMGDSALLLGKAHDITGILPGISPEQSTVKARIERAQDD